MVGYLKNKGGNDMYVKCLGTGSSGNCYALVDKVGNILLLDAGISLKEIKIGIDFQVSKIVGCLCTHAHSDHSLALKDIGKMGVPIAAPYLEKPKSDYIKGFVVMYFALTDSDGKFVHSNADGSECPVYGFFITSDVEPLRRVYITDCEFCKYRFSELDTLLLGINYMDSKIDNEEKTKKRHILNGHMSLDTGVEFIKVCDREKTLRNVVICHMSESNSDEQIFGSEIRKVTDSNIYFARKGESYQL